MSDANNGELPQGWAWAQLGDLVAPVSKVRPDEEPEREITYVDISSIDNDVHRITEPKRYRGDLAPSRARQLIRSGDTLFSTVRVYLKNTALVTDQFDGDIASTGFCVIRPVGVHSKFVSYFTLTDGFVENLSNKQRGVSYPAVRDGDVFEELIPLPPRPEQHRIVDKIEELFSDLDAGEAALAKTERLLERYRQSVLKAAVEGELTREWREQNAAGESADELLERILEERRARWEADHLAKYEAKGKKPPAAWKNRYKPPVGVEAEELPELPEGWRWVTLDEVLATGLTNGRSVRSREGGFPVLRLTAIRDGIIDLAESKSGAWTATEAAQYHVYDGDFLIVRGNGSLDLVGRGGLVRGANENVAYPDTMIRARVLETGFLPGLLCLIWDGAWVRAQITSAARTTAGIYKVNQRHLQNTILPLPPLAEQEAIVEEVDRLLSVVEAVAEEVRRQRGQAKQLRRAILQHAFEGRLVPQDPEDEPAEVLLERIRAEKNGKAPPHRSAGQAAGKKRGWKAKEGVEEVRVRF